MSFFLKIITTAEAGTSGHLGQGALATMWLGADASVARALAAEAGLLDNYESIIMLVIVLKNVP